MSEPTTEETEVTRLTRALEQYADIRHWRVEHDGRRFPLTIWIGPGATHPGEGGTHVARRALGKDEA